MVHDVEDGRDLPERSVEADQQGDQCKMADRRISKQPFEVLPGQSNESPEDEGDQPRRGDEPQPFVGPSQGRPDPHWRNTSAFTMVAECRLAEPGVGAAIAWGSQK